MEWAFPLHGGRWEGLILPSFIYLHLPPRPKMGVVWKCARFRWKNGNRFGMQVSLKKNHHLPSDF